MPKANLTYGVQESQDAANAPFHFFASSTAEWYVDTDLEALIRRMKKFDYPFNLFYVPADSKDPYAIKAYAPQVPGTVFLGFWGVSK